MENHFIRKLGPNDQVVEYIKPKRRPRWMSQEQYDAMPASITVRELRYQIHRRGFRTHQITLVTTLLDPETYPADSLTQLYGDRWQIEVEFRHLKTTMGMEVLHCKTVVGVMKELWTYSFSASRAWSTFGSGRVARSHAISFKVMGQFSRRGGGGIGAEDHRGSRWPSGVDHGEYDRMGTD